LDFVSLVILSFNRKSYLERSLNSLWANTDYPYELIIMDDGSDVTTQDYIYSLVKEKKVSAAFFNAGQNMGIGVAVNRGFRIARGQYLFKLDADLEYYPNWLSHAVGLLSRHPEIGCLGLFKYWHPPRVFSEDILNQYEDYYEVVDFVGSAIGMRREIYEQHGPWDEQYHCFGEDKAFKLLVQSSGFHLALPIPDLCHNFGFGPQHSSLIKIRDPEGGKHIYHVPSQLPLIFNPVEKGVP